MHIHFSGVGGAGMNPLAQLMQARGHKVQGSDRSFDQGKNQEVADMLRDAGIQLCPQDGSGIHSELDLIVHSAAVEPGTPEMLAAKQQKITCQSRPALLAELVDAAKPGIAISGTSGKSSVVGLVTWILRNCAKDHTVLGGAALAEGGRSYMGCFQSGPEDAPLIAEACESDGSLISYHPSIGVLHNITRDHDELDQLVEQFSVFAKQSELLLYNARCPVSKKIADEHPQAFAYGLKAERFTLDVVREGPVRAQGNLSINEHEYFLDTPQPGTYNLENAAAAMAVVAQLGVDLETAAQAISTFPGIARRFQLIGTTESKIRIIDDYAHNADKIRAVVQAAQLSSGRLIAVFQPHGFGPARFLRPELKDMLPHLLREQDKWIYAPIFYAGGTVSKDISSNDLAADLASTGQVYAAEDKQALLDWLSEVALPNDTILLMGARDPSLPQLAQAIYSLL